MNAREKHRSVLIEADDLINGDRAQAYGDARILFANWKNMARATGRAGLAVISAEDLATLMICLKVCRDAVNQKRDNTVDGAAYFDLLDQVRGL